MEQTTRTKWLQFELEQKKGRKTPIAHVFNHSGQCLGTIRWYPQWRQFCFIIEHDSWQPMKLVYAKSCLDDISAYIHKLMDERKQAEPCSKCGNPKHGYRHAQGLCRYCAGEAE